MHKYRVTKRLLLLAHILEIYPLFALCSLFAPNYVIKHEKFLHLQPDKHQIPNALQWRWKTCHLVSCYCSLPPPVCDCDVNAFNVKRFAYLGKCYIKSRAYYY